MNSAANVLDAIRDPQVEFTAEEIEAAWHALKLRHGRLQTMQAMQFAVGDAVEFTGRNGLTNAGTVTKVNQKTVSVRVGPGQWKVAPSLLRKAS